MALTDAKSPSPAVPSTEAANDKEAPLKTRILQLESEAAMQMENMKRLEEELRRRDDLLFKSPPKVLGHDSANEPLAEQLSQLAADVLSRNDQLAEKQLSRARAFLEVLRGAAWAREATPSSFKLGKFLDDLAICLELEAKKALALGNAGINAPKVAKSRRGNALTPEQSTSRHSGYRPTSALTSPAALPAPPVPAQPSDPLVGASVLPNSNVLNAVNGQDDDPTVRSQRRSGLRSPGNSQAGGVPTPPASLQGGMQSYASSYPRHSGLMDHSAPRLPSGAPLPTASSLAMSATTVNSHPGTASSLRSTEAALSPSNSGSALLIGATASPTIYSAPDREERSSPHRAWERVLEA